MNLASIWEAVADAVPSQQAVVHADTELTYAEFEDRSARLAGFLAAHGIGRDDKVALYLYNGTEFLTATFAAFKQRAVPVNVNYRYVEAELTYLLENADAKVLVFDGSLAHRVAAVRDRMPLLRVLVQVGVGTPLIDGANSFDDAITSDPAPRIERSSEDIFMCYTGGTTGMPKGVMWPHAAFVALYDPAFQALGLEPPTDLSAWGAAAKRFLVDGISQRTVAASPMMHGSAWFTSMGQLLGGNTVVVLPSRSFDPDELWRTVQAQQATSVVIVGDPFCRPMVAALEAAEADGRPYDLSSLTSVISSGAMWSAPVKESLLKHTDATLIDLLGASEGTAGASSVFVPGGGDAPVTAKFELDPRARVVTEDGKLVEPGSGEVGLLAVGGGVIPSGYYKDPDKTARTFRVIDGERFAVLGDYARVEADGTITLLGRGSVCINSGGEKIFPEEVEESLKLHPSIADAVVVGVPDDRWGEAVVAVVSVRDGFELDVDDVLATAHRSISRYKLPKAFTVVPAVLRGPSGKNDYAWARSVAMREQRP